MDLLGALFGDDLWECGILSVATQKSALAVFDLFAFVTASKIFPFYRKFGIMFIDGISRQRDECSMLEL